MGTYSGRTQSLNTCPLETVYYIGPCIGYSKSLLYSTWNSYKPLCLKDPGVWEFYISNNQIDRILIFLKPFFTFNGLMFRYLLIIEYFSFPDNIEPLSLKKRTDLDNCHKYSKLASKYLRGRGVFRNTAPSVTH